ncbi:MAG: hypothetical protein Q4C00_00895 [Bacillota bacterium]|nr:hypothetical protein [Bacillota bacterium]
MTTAEKPWNMPMTSEAEGLGGEGRETEYSPLYFDIGGENPSICYFVSADTMGQGDRDLGYDLLTKFFITMADKCMHPDYIVLINAGVNLAKESSPCAQAFRSMEKRGTKVLVSKESVSFYELGSEMKLGILSSLEEILIVLNGIDKVVSL